MRPFAALLLLACSGDDTKTSPTPSPTGDSAPITETDPPSPHSGPQGACGDPVNYDLVVTGVILTPYRQPADATVVTLEDRGWQPGRVLGTATTDAYGVFTFDATDVTSLEDCWGTLLNYVLTASREGPVGTQATELGLNTPLYNGIYDGTFVVDLSAVPIVLEEPK